MRFSLLLGLGLLLVVAACSKSDSASPTTTTTKLAAKTGGEITMAIKGTTRTGVVVDDMISLPHYYSASDASITIDSSTRPTTRIVSLYRIDTVSGSRMLMRFKINSWRDTTSALGGKGASFTYYSPTQSAPTKSMEGGVPSNANADLSMRVVRLYFQGVGTKLVNVRGEYAMSPVVNGASGTLITGRFNLPLDSIAAW